MSEEGSASNHLMTKCYIDTNSSNINYVKVDGSSFMSGDFNMNEQRVKNTLDPTDEQDTVNKRYLESQLNDYLKRNGQSPMTFDLNMNNYRIRNVKDYDPATSSLQDVPNVKYIQDNFIGSSSGILTGNLNAGNNRIFFLGNPVDGSDAINKQYADSNFLSSNISADLDMKNHKIINVETPGGDSDVANKKYVDDKKKIQPSHSLENTFQYVMDDIDQFSTEYGLIADKIDNLNWSLHSKKKVLYFRAQKDGVNYRYRFGIELGDASDKEHTVCIEQFFTSETFWNKAQITINGTGVVLPYNHITKFHYNVGSTEYYYTKTIIQVKKITAVSHFIYYTTHIDNVTASAPNDLQLYATVYGVDNYLSNVDSSVYSLKLFIEINNNMKMLTNIDMRENKIIRLGDPTNNYDAVTKAYVDTAIQSNIDYPVVNGLILNLVPN